MKIAIIGSRGYPYVYSGYETFVKELSERLALLGFEITVYCHKNLFETRPKLVNNINLKYFPAIETKSLSQLTHTFQAMLHACFCDYDIIFVVNSANGPFGFFSKATGKKTAINVDGQEWLRPKWKGLGAKYFRWASWIATKLYDVIITDSSEMQKIYEKEFGAQSTMIAYGANVRYSTNPGLIKKWDLQPGEYYLIVGRLVPDNNAHVIVREFLSSRSKKRMVVVGDVTYSDTYAQELKSLNDPRLIFTGYVKNQEMLAELYHNAFAYCHGHEFGGTNPTLLKALAYGCAVCALDTVFSREVLKDGEFGIFFTKEPGNLSSLLHKIEERPENIARLKDISRSRIAENYTWEKIADQYRALFEKMTKNGRR